MTTIDLCFVLFYNGNRTNIEVFRMNEKEIFLEDLNDSIKNTKETQKKPYPFSTAMRLTLWFPILTTNKEKMEKITTCKGTEKN